MLSVSMTRGPQGVMHMICICDVDDGTGGVNPMLLKLGR